MYSYPEYLDENISRPIATTVFTITLITLLRPELQFLMFGLFIDFILRYLHPKISPLVHVTRLIGVTVLKNEVAPKFSPPKRFAILIGILVSGIVSTGILLSLPFLIFTGSTLLLFAAFLQGFFSYCIGCRIHDYFVKIGIFKKNQRLSSKIPNPVNVK